MGRNRVLFIPLAAALALVLMGAGPPATQAPNFELNWYSVNEGGAIASWSTSFELGLSVGQEAAGKTNSAGYELGIGFWYGGISEEVCDCGVWGDVNDDDAINPADVVVMVNFVYKGVDGRVQPPACPEDAGDVNCDSAVNPADVVLYVNYVYKGITPWPCPDPCGP